MVNGEHCTDLNNELTCNERENKRNAAYLKFISSIWNFVINKTLKNQKMEEEAKKKEERRSRQKSEKKEAKNAKVH